MLEFIYLFFIIILRINAWLLYCVITQIARNACSKIRYIYYFIQMIVSCLQMEVRASSTITNDELIKKENQLEH